MTRQSIEARQGSAVAAQLLDRLPHLKLPIPVLELAVSHGILVRSVPLDDELSGIAFIKDQERVIVFNSKHHANRQRFTIAHELGHHLMHDKMLQGGVHVDKGVLRRDSMSATGTNKHEIQANAFAAELLMPRRFLVDIVDEHFDIENDRDIIILATKFGVSQAAMTNRIASVFF